MAIVRCEARISGIVQGVGFRYFCREEAIAAGLAGWVTNAPDGTVRAAFEGESDVVARMLAWARHGPPSARVSDVDVTYTDPAGEAGFMVR